MIPVQLDVKVIQPGFRQRVFCKMIKLPCAPGIGMTVEDEFDCYTVKEVILTAGEEVIGCRLMPYEVKDIDSAAKGMEIKGWNG